MSITPESVGVLLRSSDFGDRLRAVNQIRQLAPAIGFELIQVAMQDTNPRVRSCQSVSKSGTAKSAPCNNALAR
jgi:ABC-type uncharacterized transport system substrate-binding protein